jgi:hypothetical protein
MSFPSVLKFLLEHNQEIQDKWSPSNTPPPELPRAWLSTSLGTLSSSETLPEEVELLSLSVLYVVRPLCNFHDHMTTNLLGWTTYKTANKGRENLPLAASLVKEDHVLDPLFLPNLFPDWNRDIRRLTDPADWCNIVLSPALL